MPLSGSNKKEYQREYMKRKRGEGLTRSNKTEEVHKMAQNIANKGKYQDTDPRVLHLAEALIDPVKREKLVKISSALDKTITGLVGKREHAGDLVRFGINGFTFREIKEVLTQHIVV